MPRSNNTPTAPMSKIARAQAGRRSSAKGNTPPHRISQRHKLRMMESTETWYMIVPSFFEPEEQELQVVMTGTHDRCSCPYLPSPKAVAMPARRKLSLHFVS
jgi:hypothetical protein